MGEKKSRKLLTLAGGKFKIHAVSLRPSATVRSPTIAKYGHF